MKLCSSSRYKAAKLLSSFDDFSKRVLFCSYMMFMFTETESLRQTQMYSVSNVAFKILPTNFKKAQLVSYIVTAKRTSVPISQPTRDTVFVMAQTTKPLSVNSSAVKFTAGSSSAVSGRRVEDEFPNTWPKISSCEEENSTRSVNMIGSRMIDKETEKDWVFECSVQILTRIFRMPASNGNRHKFHQVKRPNFLNDTITRIQLTPNLSSLAPFQSDLCTENGITVVILSRQKVFQPVDNTPTPLLWIIRSQKILRHIVIVEDIINHTRTLPLLRIHHLVHQFPFHFLWSKDKRRVIRATFDVNLTIHHHRIRPIVTETYVFLFQLRLPRLCFCIKHRHRLLRFFPHHTTPHIDIINKGSTNHINLLPIDDGNHFSIHVLRNVGDGLNRVRCAVNAEHTERVKHVHLGTHGDIESTVRHERKWFDEDQAVSAVEFPVENVEVVIITNVALAEDGIDTRGNEFPETLGNKGESRVMVYGYTSYDVNGNVVWKWRNQRRRRH
ncbi:hypothetical protein HID58_031814 [Brassica napus]|uniref:Uncharacterized protein n=1 Tax=Brassica napus TaxID=3708 RepID=A0ABQ8BUQ1_BRANA|nr:hypothetical protein HID58_031814 [Brassica napus]